MTQPGGSVVGGDASLNGSRTKNHQFDVEGDGSSRQATFPVRALNFITARDGSLAGLLVGLLLVLLLLTCCTCCLYCLFVVLRNYTRRRPRNNQGVGLSGHESERAESTASETTVSIANSSLASRAAARQQRRLLRHRQKSDSSSRQSNKSTFFSRLKLRAFGDGFKQQRFLRSKIPTGNGETDSLARNQNTENAARLKAQALIGRPRLEEAGQRSSARGVPAAPQPPVRHIQSILKRPSSAAPLARFESIPYSDEQMPPPPPPRVPTRAGRGGAALVEQDSGLGPASPKRGALASSLTSAASQRAEFKPTPATRQRQQQPVARPSDSSSPAFGGGATDFLSSKTMRNLTGETVGLPSAPRSQTKLPASYSITSPQIQESTPSTSSSKLVPASDELRYKSRTTKVEQQTSSNSSGRLTVYEYSSQLAQYSESYMIRQQEAREQRSLRDTPPRTSPIKSTNLDEPTSNERAL